MGKIGVEVIKMDFLQLSHEKVLELLPQRAIESHKGDYGKILLLCGSLGYTGAAYLAAMGALRTGAGLVYLGVPQSIYAIEAVKCNEPIVFPLPEEGGMLSSAAVDVIIPKLKDMDAVLIGPGLGKSEDVTAVVLGLLKSFTGPVVLDADGINAVAPHMDIVRERRYPTILTPHPGEFARLGVNASEDRFASAQSFAKDNGCILVLKGHGTVITDGDTLYRNPTGNPGMAVGGSGDVLAGMIVSLLGQGLQPLSAAACGAYLHGLAGDVCAEKLGQYGMLPTDMVEVLPRLMK